MNDPVLISMPNLSLAWAQAFDEINRAPGHRIIPLTLSFEGFPNGEVAEDLDIRKAVNDALAESGMQTVHTVANTIFPQSLWRRARGNRTELYSEYLLNLPSYIDFCAPKNHKGLYFARLIAFDVDPRTGAKLQHLPTGMVPSNGNQLEFIITHCHKGARASLFQAAIFDPARDHTAQAQLGFPCLQHVTFVPDFAEQTLSLNAFYATQQLFEKGYGNFLGLARLGLFVAGEVGLSLHRVNCFAGIEKMDRRPKAGPCSDTLRDVCRQALTNAAQESVLA